MHNYPEFIPEGIGKCENCPADNVEINISIMGFPICKHCCEDELTVCSVCGEIYISDSMDFLYDEETDSIICEYCQDEM